MLISSILDHGNGAPALTVGQDESAHDVAVFLEARKIGAAVVIGEGGEILGIVSERDIVWAYAKDEAGMPKQSVKSLMTSPVLTCSPETRISDVALLMDAHNIRHMPVVEGTKLIGVVSIRDLVARRLLALETDVEVLRRQLLGQPGLTQASH